MIPLLSLTQQVAYEFGGNMTPVQIVIQTALKWPQWIPNMSPTSRKVILLFLSTSPFTQSTFSSVLFFYGHPEHFASSIEVTGQWFLAWNPTLKLVFFTLSALQKLLSTAESLYSIFLHLKRKFDADTLFFWLCHFLGMPKIQIEKHTLYLTWYYSTITHATALVQAWNDSTHSSPSTSSCRS